MISAFGTTTVFGEMIVPENTRVTTTMKRLDVPVQFTGVVTVKVPAHLSHADAKLLAGKLALARILATSDNPDGPEDDGCEDYAEECSAFAQATAEQDWDSARFPASAASGASSPRHEPAWRRKQCRPSSMRQLATDTVCR